MHKRHALIIAGICALNAAPSLAVEGGTGAYLLGSRDSVAGIAPPPGNYFSTDIVHLDGSVDVLALGGLPFADVTSQAWIAKLNYTHSFGQPVFGGQAAVTLTLPVVSGDLSFSGTLASGLGGEVSDSKSGLSDLIVTPMVGWSNGMNHWVTSASIFASTGYYQSASVDLADRSINAISFSKNRWAIDPAIGYTYLNPGTGFEATAVGGVTLSQENPATNYQTAPEFHIEATAMQHLPNKVAYGLTGYAYKQFQDDSGSGAESIKFATGQDSLAAQVYGIGPLITYSTKIGGQSVSMKAKYIHEFDGEKRFQSDVIWLNASLVF